MTNTLAFEIRKKLLKIAQEKGRPSQEILQYYAMERFLFRLSQSEYQQRFVLKGALLLHARELTAFRATQDIDLLGITNNAPDHIAAICKKLCAFEFEDGIQFDPETVISSVIKPTTDYQGVQVKFKGVVDRSKVHIRIDVGFADAVHPKPVAFVFPTILPLPAPNLLGYTYESVIAEKVDAMIQLGEPNSRMKDFYDVWYLANRISFKMSILTEALKATLTARKTEVPESPHIFEPSFCTNSIKQEQWKNFCRQNRFEGMPEFPQLMGQLEMFLKPVLMTICRKEKRETQWISESFLWGSSQ